MDAPVTDAQAIAQAVFQGCAANVGLLIGTELEMGEVSVDTVAEPPQGDLAVLPLACEVDEEVLANLTLGSPLAEIATLGRRMLGSEEPDKESDLGSEDLDAIGEVLNLMSGAADQAIREHVNASLHCRPLPWWRTPDPGENHFEEGEFLLATGCLSGPEGRTVQLFFRFPPQLLEQGTQVRSSKRSERVLLLGLSEELQQSLRPILESARLQVEAMEPNADDIEKTCEANTVILLGDQNDDFELCRRLRLRDATWTVSTILCMAEPTHSRVVRAIECGASHVLRVPGEEITVLRVLNLVKPE